MTLRFLARKLGTFVKAELHASIFQQPMTTFPMLKGMQPKLVKMKINSPYFRSLLTPETTLLSEMFKKYGFEVRIAGGAVRDILMDKEPVDIDFATTATPEQMIHMFTAEDIRMLNKKGEKHGTVTVRINDNNFEITTLRIDVNTNGRHAEVEFTTNWELDAARRDLTVNAMFVDVEGMLYDYFNGVEHVKRRQITFVGDAASRISEDYLRILRYFRFYGRIAVNPDSHNADNLKAIKENMEGMQMISGERIWGELKKILTGNYAKHLMLRMIDLGIAPFIGLPSSLNLKTAVEFEDVCNRAVALKPQAVTLLAALLKDEGEVLTFHSRLKLSKYERDLALFLVNNRKGLNGGNTLLLFQTLVLTSNSKQSDTLEWTCELAKYMGDRFLLERLQAWEIPKFPMNGHILMTQCGLKQGPQLQKALQKLKKEWIESEYKLSREQLLDQLQSIVKVK